MKRKLNFEIGLLVAAVVLVSFVLQGCSRTAKIVNIEKGITSTRADGSQHTVKEVKEAILDACAKLQWGAVEEKPGLIKASLDIRTHHAEIDINYSSRTYFISYVDSYNLRYNNGYIHKNYNLWVTDLSNLIDRNLKYNLK